MSSELSRVEKYRKGRKKNDTKKPPSSSTRVNRNEAKTKTESGPVKQESGALRRRSGNAAPARRNASASRHEKNSAAGMSRLERHSSGAKENGKEDYQIPERSSTYGSRRIIISKYFTNSLIFLFIILTAFLVYWGIKGAPPLEELW